MTSIEIRTEYEPELTRSLGPLHVIAVGISCIIGAGIFVLTGQAAAIFAGPAIVISFAIAGLGCLMAGLCYSEFASMVPICGSAYSYAYATMGKLPAWFIGWNLVLEYIGSASTVAVGWSGYFGDFMSHFGFPIPTALDHAPFVLNRFNELSYSGSVINLPAVLLIAAMTIVLVMGIKATANFNIVMVAIKLTIVLVVIFVSIGHIVPANHHPFVPPNTGRFGQFGWTGVFRATGVLFFAYLGFDAVCTTAQEAKRPQRDLPLGLLGSLVICTGLYMMMSYVLTGIANYTTLDVAHPVSQALEALPATRWLAQYVNVGAIVGLASVVLIVMLAQSRIFYAMACDGMIPSMFREVHPQFRTPVKSTVVVGVSAMLFAGFIPLEILGQLVSIGTLAAFVVVCFGVMRLRKRAPNARRPFRTPFVWVTAPCGIAICAFMMAFLPLDTWLRLAVWTAIGFLIYFFYSSKHAKPSLYVLDALHAP